MTSSGRTSAILWLCKFPHEEDSKKLPSTIYVYCAYTYICNTQTVCSYTLHLQRDVIFLFYLQLMKLAAGLQSRASTCSGSSVFSPARSVHSLVCSHSNTFHCWEAHISNTKSAVGTKIRMVQQHDIYHTKRRLTLVFIWCY